MSRRMSMMLTVDQVRARTKTVTRRHRDTWRDLKPGDRLTLVEKAQGLRKGDRQRQLAEVEILDVRLEPLSQMSDDTYGWAECAAEGFPEMPPQDFVDMWLESHGSPEFPDQNAFMAYEVRRIEWRYLDAPDPAQQQLLEAKEAR